MVEIEEYIRDNIDGLNVLLGQKEKINKIRDELLYNKDRMIFICGNGGSAATASHLAGDLQQLGFRAICLTDNTNRFSAICNDTEYKYSFKNQLENVAKPGETLIVISGSGNSPNILEAMQYAIDHRILIIAFLGITGGEALKLCDQYNELYVHVSKSMNISENVHVVLCHLVKELIWGKDQ